MRTSLLIACFLASFQFFAQKQIVLENLDAFPTAEGFGKDATGGRGGVVVEVTNLNDSGPGSLRHALVEIREPRIIVFKVSGTINAKSNLPIYSGRGNVTIAGETAPGGGILIKNGSLSIQADNVIVRHLRFRMNSSGNPQDGHNMDGIRVRSSNQSVKIKNIIIDHCSVSWALDENISVKYAEKVTVQNSILGECIKGMLMQHAKKVSVLNNLFALNNSRNIMANSSDNTDFAFEQINNIVYGFKWATSASEGMAFSVIGNRYRLSDDFETSTNYPITLTPPDSANDDNGNIKTTHAFLDGNILDESLLGLYRKELKPYLFSSPKNKSSYRATDAGNNKLDSKLLPHIGASSWKRDDVDKRLIQSYQNSSGTNKTSGSFPSISSGTGYKDSDKDGIDDNWELSHSISSSLQVKKNWDFGNYTVVNNAGYNAIEIYFAWLSGDFGRLSGSDVTEQPQVSNSCSNGSQYEVTASDSQEGNGPCNLVDDNIKTRWSAEGDGNWVIIDMGSSKEVNYVQIAFYGGDGRTYDFELQVSNDGASWTDVYGKRQRSSGQTEGLEDFEFPSQNARYVRYVGYGNSSNNWNNLLEMKVGANTGGTTTIPTTGVQVGRDQLDLSIGQTAKLNAAVQPSDATHQGVTWSSRDDKIATVSQDGTIKALATGSTIVTLKTSNGNHSDTISVSVGGSGGGACSNGSKYQVTASESQEGNGPCNLVDDNIKTRWSVNGDGHWASLDMGSSKDVNEVQLAFYAGDERTYDFDLQVSNDGVSWTDVYGKRQRSSGQTEQLENFNFSSQNVRYVRYVGHGNSSNNWNNLLEMKVVTNSVSVGDSGGACSNGSKYQVTASDSQEGNGPCNLVDENIKTRWSVNGDGHWASLDMGSSKEVDQVQLAFYAGDERTYDFDLQVSNDGVSWRDVYGNRQRSSGQTEQLENFNFSSQKVRYVRYVGHGNSSNNWNNLLEMRVGAGAAATSGTALKARLPERLQMNGPVVAALYPNPTADAVHIGGITGKKEITIIDFSGRILHTCTSRLLETSCDLSDYPTGTYNIRVDGPESTNVFTVLKE
ncbi:discoidin domain-containing protein [Zobellia laminariae]|uniref:discoidin domain-containing protein n=1 Tax=Zobellia laminariae TaxID=248906 RepID=UPI0012D8697C|nr:T9SS C-terminal target domain-containing protein [Zobellia laminariae]